MLPYTAPLQPLLTLGEAGPQCGLLRIDIMSTIYMQSDDTRAAIFLANLILARAAERGYMDDPIEQQLTDMIDIFIWPAVRVAHHWSAVEPYAGPHRRLIHGTLVIIGQAIEVYTARALALLPSQLVAQGHAAVENNP